MAVHSARPFRTGWITAAACSCLLAGGVGGRPASARGQTPTSPARVPQVEQWQGNQKLGAEPAPPPALVPVAPPPSPLESMGAPLPPVRSEATWTPPAPVPTITPVAAVKVTPPAADHKKLGEQIVRTTTKLADECQSALGSAAMSLRSSGDRLVESLTAPIRGNSDKAAPTTTVVFNAPSPADRPAAADDESLPWYKVVWLQLAVGGSALVVGPLMVALMLGLMLRRSGLQLRVEVVNSGGPFGSNVAYGISRIDTSMPDVPAKPIGRIEPDLSSLAGVAAEEHSPLPEPKDAEPTAEQFDLGPSYEEDRLAKEEAERLRELAILQEVFEENLRLHLEIRSLQEASAEVPLPETVTVPDQPEPLIYDSLDDLVSEPVGYLTDENDQAV